MDKITVTQAANDFYEDELLACLTKGVKEVRGNLGSFITRPMSDGRRWVLMPLDQYEAELTGRQVLGEKAAFEAGEKSMQERAAEAAINYEGKPCGPAQLWTDEQREFFDCGQVDASSSIATAIRNLTTGD